MIPRRHVLRLGGLLTLTGALGTTAVPAMAGVRASTIPTQAGEPGTDNLLPNPGLEAVANGRPEQWTPWNAASTTLVHSSSEQVHGGTFSVRLDDPNTVGPGLRSSFVAVTPGASYLATAYSYNVTGSSQLLLEFWNSSRVRIAAHTATNTQVGRWEQLSLEFAAPAAATHATVMFYCTSVNVGTAYFDDAALQQVRWKVSIWGGDFLTRGPATDTLTVRVAALEDPVAFDRVDAFGTVLTFLDEHRVSGPGMTARWDTSGAFRWDAGRKCLVLPAGADGGLTISGMRFQPPPREGFVNLTVHEANGDQDHEVWVAAGGYASPDHEAERGLAPQALVAARRASDYLETRRTPDGGVLIGHSTWPGDAQPDPQGNASVATGNLRLWQVTGDPTFRDRAVRTLDWLAAVQLDNGGFGFPWAWGGARGHFAYGGHYPENGADHPAGTPYAIITSNAAGALVEGYEALDRPEYLAAARRAADYLLHDRNGFQWLDDAHTKGSIPYCTMDPVDAQGGHTTNIYNIDGSSLGLLARLAELTDDRELRTYGDALARNLYEHIEADASIAYGWYVPTYKPTGYAHICYAGLLTWGRLRGIDPWVSRARDGLTWMTNVDRPSLLLWEDEAEALGGLDNTNAVLGYLQNRISTQRADGSWTGGANTRDDAGGLTLIGALLKQMEFHA